MNWNELKDSIEKLPPEVREMPIQAWGESISLSDCSIEIAQEAMYYDPEYCDEGCIAESEIDEQEIDISTMTKVCEKGTPYIWIE